jgi:hypothetical protein
MSVEVSVYTLSRLVHASPADWDREIRSIEENKLFMNRYYAPLRDGAVAYCKDGSPRLDEIAAQVEAGAQRVSASRGANPVRDNLDAFGSFVRNFYPRIREFERNRVRDGKKSGCAFCGLELIGLPHFSVIDSTGKSRHVLLHASKWEENDLKSYLELLSIIIENKLGGRPDSLWCMDLRNGKDLNWRSSRRIRSKCESAARLYARIAPTLEQSLI